MGTTYYGKAAYEGFARALGQKMGLTVTIADGPACIDGSGTIRIPAMNTYQTPEQFRTTCGTIIHEMAHQFYGSHEVFASSSSDPLFRGSLNTIMDVADETWLDGWWNTINANPRPGQLLTAANESAAQNQRIWDWSGGKDSGAAWRIQCAGILKARLPKYRYVQRNATYVAKMVKRYGVDGPAVMRVIARAKLLKREIPDKNPKRFKKILKLAQELADLLKPFAPPPGSPQPESGGIAVTQAAAAGAPSLPAGGTEASAAEVIRESLDPTYQGGSGSGGGASPAPSGRKHDVHAFEMVLPAIRRIAERLATDGDGANYESGLTRGSSVAEAYRLSTDGLCMGRWARDDHADGVSVAVLLDTSGSMSNILSEVAGIARAFVIGLDGYADTKCWEFRSGHVDESATRFDTVECGGGTPTGRALKVADEWLDTRPGHRWAVVITDGAPSDPERLTAECARAMALGINVMAVGLGPDTAKRIAATMPGATMYAAADVGRLSIELTHAASVITR